MGDGMYTGANKNRSSYYIDQGKLKGPDGANGPKGGCVTNMYFSTETDYEWKNAPETRLGNVRFQAGDKIGVTIAPGVELEKETMAMGYSTKNIVPLGVDTQTGNFVKMEEKGEKMIESNEVKNSWEEEYERSLAEDTDYHAFLKTQPEVWKSPSLIVRIKETLKMRESLLELQNELEKGDPKRSNGGITTDVSFSIAKAVNSLRHVDKALKKLACDNNTKEEILDMVKISSLPPSWKSILHRVNPLL